MVKITQSATGSLIGISDDGRIVYNPDRSPVDQTQIDGQSVYQGNYVAGGAVADDLMVLASEVRRAVDAVIEQKYHARIDQECAAIDAREKWLDGLATVKGGAYDPNVEGY